MSSPMLSSEKCARVHFIEALALPDAGRPRSGCVFPKVAQVKNGSSRKLWFDTCWNFRKLSDVPGGFCIGTEDLEAAPHIPSATSLSPISSMHAVLSHLNSPTSRLAIPLSCPLGSKSSSTYSFDTVSTNSMGSTDSECSKDSSTGM